MMLSEPATKTEKFISVDFEYVSDYDWKEFAQELIRENHSHVDNHNRRYKSKKRQISYWTKKESDIIENYVKTVHDEKRLIKGEHEGCKYLIYLTTYNEYRILIDASKYKIQGVGFNSFHREEGKSSVYLYNISSSGDYKHPVYDKQTNMITYSIRTRKFNEREILYDVEKIIKGEVLEEDRGFNSVSYIEDKTKQIIDEFIKLQSGDYRDRARTFSKIHNEREQLTALFRNTPDTDYEKSWDSFRSKQDKSKTVEITNSINKLTFENIMKVFDELPPSVQNSIYAETIERMSEQIKSLAEKKSENLEELQAFYKKLADINGKEDLY